MHVKKRNDRDKAVEKRSGQRGVAMDRSCFRLGAIEREAQLSHMAKATRLKKSIPQIGDIANTCFYSTVRSWSSLSRRVGRNEMSGFVPRVPQGKPRRGAIDYPVLLFYAGMLGVVVLFWGWFGWYAVPYLFEYFSSLFL